MKQKLELMPTGSYTLDKMLNGGFKNYSVIEIYGPAGSGKTRLIHQLLLMASIIFKEHEIYHIDNEGNFRPIIIQDIGSRIPKYDRKVLNKILISRPITHEQFLSLLNLLSEKEIKFLSIDTLVTHIRSLPIDDYMRNLKQILLKIRELANKGAIVVFTNQVTMKEENIAAGGKFIDYVVDYKLSLEKYENRIRCKLLKPQPIREEFFRIVNKGFLGYNEPIAYEMKI